MHLRLMLLPAVYPENVGAQCIKDQPEDNYKIKFDLPIATPKKVFRNYLLEQAINLDGTKLANTQCPIVFSGEALARILQDLGLTPIA